jgi:hypothetical protein
MGIFPPAVFFAVGEGSLWITDFAPGEVIRIAPPLAEDASPPTPEPSPQPPAHAISVPGVPFDVCRPTTIDGAFGDGLTAVVVFEEERVPGAGCVGSEGFQRLGIGDGQRVQILSERLTDVFTEDAYKVWPYAAPDLNGDGVDEIALAKQQANGTMSLWFIQLVDGEPVPVTERACDGICQEVVPWHVLIGPVTGQDGTVTQGGVTCDGDRITEWRSLPDDPGTVTYREGSLVDGTFRASSRDRFQRAYPPSGVGELCGSPTSDAGVPAVPSA